VVKIDPKKTIFLIDGSSFLYRAYYGTRPLHTSKGEPVQAVYSFCRMIKKLIDKFSIRYGALVWDSKGPTTRHAMYQEYKATRQAPPSDLFTQKEHIIRFGELIGLHQVSAAGYEADDLMYAIGKDMQAQGFDVILVTADKDMGQALTPQLSLYDFFKDQLLSQSAFEEKIGFPVEKLPFYYALLGDASDNIPGVKGIGEKTAQQLVTQFASLEDLYACIDGIESARIKKALLVNKDNAFLSYRLFLLVYVQTGTTPQKLLFNPALWSMARPLFQALEFKSLLDAVGATKEQQQAFIEQKIEQLAQKDFRMIITRAELVKVVEQIRSVGAVAVDTEGEGLDPLRCNLVGISLCTNEHTAYYIPFGHRIDEQQLPYNEVRELLAPVFASPTITKYFHNAKFDIHMLAAHGLPVEGPVFDTMIAASLVTKDWQRISLKQLALFYFNEHMLTFAEVVKANKFPNFSYVPLKLATDYAANDAYQTWKLAQLVKQLLRDEGMEELFATIEMPLMHILCGWKSVVFILIVPC
jgi:DNA polymerase-1